MNAASVLPRRALPISLALTLLLAACAPVVQTAQGDVPLRIVTGAPLLVAPRIPAQQLTDETPDATYITFDDCAGVAVAAGDVRRLGPEVADQACHEVSRRLNAAQSLTQGIGLVAALPALILLYLVYSALTAFGGH